MCVIRLKRSRRLRRWKGLDEPTDQLTHGGRRRGHEVEHGCHLTTPLRRRQIFQLRTAGDPGKQTGKRASNGALLEPADPGLVRNPSPVRVPKAGGGLLKLDALGFNVIRLAQQVSHREAEIECGIAPVGYLVIEKDESSIMYQDVLRAEVTMDKANRVGSSSLDNSPDEGPCADDLVGCIRVVGLDSQRFEIRRVLEDGLKLGPPAE